MSWPAALEVLLSLTLQAAALYAVTLAMQRRASSEASKDYVWKAFYLLLLTLTALAWFGPHLRFVSPQFLLGNPRVAGTQVWQLAISRAVVWLWGGGVLIGAISLVLGIVAALRELRTTVPLEETQLAALLPGDADFQASARGVEFRTGSNALHPYCWQFSRPVVVLPCHLWQATAETIRPIILHELAHLRANHPLHLFLQHIVEILFWYHPAIWQASRRRQTCSARSWPIIWPSSRATMPSITSKDSCCSPVTATRRTACRQDSLFWARTPRFKNESSGSSSDRGIRHVPPSNCGGCATSCSSERCAWRSGSPSTRRPLRGCVVALARMVCDGAARRGHSCAGLRDRRPSPGTTSSHARQLQGLTDRAKECELLARIDRRPASSAHFLCWNYWYAWRSWASWRA